MNWVEVFNNFGTKIDKRTIIQVWLARDTLIKVVEAGFRAVLSDSGAWYLTGPHVKYNWTHFYAQEPLDGVPSHAEPLVLGGEACAWSETMDSSNVEAIVFPRAAAVAEKLWSPRHVNDTAAAAPRIAAFRCLLNDRGIGAATLRSLPKGNDARAVPFPSEPGACLSQ